MWLNMTLNCMFYRWLRYFPLSPTFGVPLSILKEMELQDQDSEKEEEESIVPDNNTKV